MARRTKRLLIGLVLLMVAALPLGFGVRAWRRHLMRQSFETTLADAAERGEAMYVSALYAEEIPDDQNGAAMWPETWKAVTDVIGTHQSALVIDWENNSPGIDVESNRKALVELAPALIARLDEATARPRYRFSLDDTTEGWPLPEDVMQHVQTVAVIAPYVESTVDQSAKLHAIETLLRLAARIERKSPLEHTVAQLIQKGALEVLRAEVEQSLLDPALAFEALDPRLRANALEGFPEALRGARAWLVSNCAGVAELDGTSEADLGRFAASVEEARSEGIRPFEALHACVLVHEVSEELLAEDVSDHREVAQLIANAAADFENLDSPFTRRLDPEGARTRDWLEHVAGVFANMAKTERAIALARIALAARVHYAQHGAWPATPSDLAAAFPDGVPLDPIAGEDFVFTLPGDGTLEVTAKPADPDVWTAWQFQAYPDSPPTWTLSPPE